MHNGWLIINYPRTSHGCCLCFNNRSAVSRWFMVIGLVNCLALSSSLLALIACVAATQFPFPLLRKPLCYITLILSVFGWFQIGKINNKHTFSCQKLISSCANCLTGNWNSFTYSESYKPSVSCLSWEACYIFIRCYCLGCLNNIIPYKIVYY